MIAHLHPPSMRPRPTLVALALAGLAALPSPGNDTGPILGFTPANARTQRDWEAKFKAIPDPGRLRENMRRLSARPHHVGSPYDKDNAEWLREQFRSYGWQAEIEQFDVLFPTPVERVVEMVAPTTFRAKLQEPALSIDPTS